MQDHISEHLYKNGTHYFVSGAGSMTSGFGTYGSKADVIWTGTGYSAFSVMSATLNELYVEYIDSYGERKYSYTLANPFISVSQETALPTRKPTASQGNATDESDVLASMGIWDMLPDISSTWFGFASIFLFCVIGIAVGIRYGPMRQKTIKKEGSSKKSQAPKTSALKDMPSHHSSLSDFSSGRYENHYARGVSNARDVDSDYAPSSDSEPQTLGSYGQRPVPRDIEAAKPTSKADTISPTSPGRRNIAKASHSRQPDSSNLFSLITTRLITMNEPLTSYSPNRNVKNVERNAERNSNLTTIGTSAVSQGYLPATSTSQSLKTKDAHRRTKTALW